MKKAWIRTQYPTPDTPLERPVQMIQKSQGFANSSICWRRPVISDTLAVIWGFPKMVVPQNGWFIVETLLKWMIWGYHHLRKHPYKYTDGSFWVGYFSIHFRHFHQGAPKSRFDPPELKAPVLCERRPLHVPIGKTLAAEKSIFFLKIYENWIKGILKGDITSFVFIINSYTRCWFEVFFVFSPLGEDSH